MVRWENAIVNGLYGLVTSLDGSTSAMTCMLYNLGMLEEETSVKGICYTPQVLAGRYAYCKLIRPIVKLVNSPPLAGQVCRYTLRYPAVSPHARMRKSCGKSGTD